MFFVVLPLDLGVELSDENNDSNDNHERESNDPRVEPALDHTI